MSGEGFKFQASVKDADGDMVNVRADSAEELGAYLSNFPVAEYAQFKANVRGGAALGQVTQPQAPAQQGQPEWSQAPAQQAPPQQQSGGWGAAQQQSAPPQQGGVQLHPEGKQCQQCATTLQYKVVTRKSDQKQFKFWACPNQRSRDDGHSSEFAN